MATEDRQLNVAILSKKLPADDLIETWCRSNGVLTDEAADRDETQPWRADVMLAPTSTMLGQKTRTSSKNKAAPASQAVILDNALPGASDLPYTLPYLVTPRGTSRERGYHGRRRMEVGTFGPGRYNPTFLRQGASQPRMGRAGVGPGQ